VERKRELIVTATLDALQAQTTAYVATNYQTGDDDGQVVVDAIRVVIGEPGNLSDPRRWLVFAANHEIVEIVQAAQAGGTTIRDLFEGTDRERAIAIAWDMMNIPKVMARQPAPDDRPWRLLAGYLENVTGGATATWEGMDSLDWTDDIIADLTGEQE
jgi:hypothetical protein